ncbi:MAG: tRNA pseudouridine(38-40) synthase TruA [Planctomycetes bacterium]|nr:tRNA pseudouridine(38-40) synthase TruA [Planctomycetota bacterium]MCH9724488.1 tRNA pseudouridine(38-40) synthase TruA [Planctomycetota bacterium]MCH9774853.1 tRNA pseudouridine(38-40) synthase TruA [Planctomycetota bacterium]MCH9792848.1 tRNA pseudouridine(38-40) synthase TruA [Planctomycetota bacterium]
MRNIKLTLAYDGSEYAGWQVQPNGLSVQACVESAIEQLTQQKSSVLVAGRTDAGVHAVGQVANFQTTSSIPCNNIQSGLQHFLPDSISVREVSEVDASFHATYSAVQKRYRYVIHNMPVGYPFLKRYVSEFSRPLDEKQMHTAGQFLLGKHDFRCFESHYPNKATSVRTVKELTVQRASVWPVWSAGPLAAMPDSNSSSSEFITVDIVADGFLYNMVRTIVGTLIDVGVGRWSPGDVQKILTSMDRSQAGATAPACGLYLIQVDYDL